MAAQGTDALCKLIGKAARRRREELGISQAELAAAVTARGAARWTAATVSSIESGRRNVGLTELADLLDILKTTLGSMLPTVETALNDPLVQHRAKTLVATEWQGDFAAVEIDMREVQQRRLEENVWGTLTNGRHPTRAERDSLETACHALFGRSLIAEREARAELNESGARIAVARLGHATRTIIRDLEPYFRARGVDERRGSPTG